MINSLYNKLPHQLAIQRSVLRITAMPQKKMRQSTKTLQMQFKSLSGNGYDMRRRGSKNIRKDWKIIDEKTKETLYLIK